MHKLAIALLMLMISSSALAQLSAKEEHELYDKAAKELVREATTRKGPNALRSREAVPSEDIAGQIHAAVTSSVYGKEHIEKQPA